MSKRGDKFMANVAKIGLILLVVSLIWALLSGCNDYKKQYQQAKLDKDLIEKELLDSITDIYKFHSAQLDTISAKHLDELDHKDDQIRARQRIVNQYAARIDALLGATETSQTDEELQEFLIDFFEWWINQKEDE